MDSQKMQYVKEALNVLVTLLNEKDRIMLIKFDNSAQELLPFTNVSQNKIHDIKKTIQNLQGDGGTNILSGLQVAVKGLQNRTDKNPITSVFLLSDGQDNRNSIEYLKQNGILKDSPYTIHTFGFGQDHDPVLLNDICKIMDGNFYYVAKIDSIEQQFIIALGGLFSVVAQEMEVTVRLKDHVNKEFNQISVAKTYGDMWIHNPKLNEYSILIKQFMKNESKEFLFDLQIPPIQHQLEENERKIEVLEVEIVLYNNNDNKKQNPFKKVNQLTLTFYNENEEVPIMKQVSSKKFELNYFRVKGADAIQKSIQENRKRDFGQAVNILVDFLNEIENYKNRKELQVLYEDILDCMKICDQNQFDSQQGKMISIQKSHMEQKAIYREKTKRDDNEDEEQQQSEFIYGKKIKKQVNRQLQELQYCQVESEQNTLLLNSKQTQYFSAMISIGFGSLTNNQYQEQRQPIDIVCVIDISGFMDSLKIVYVKEALYVLISLLNANDRIMLVQFESKADQLLPFTNVSQNNIPIIKRAIQQLKSVSHTTLLSGLQVAIDSLQNRQFKNPVTSVFLLSDGQADISSVYYLKKKDSPYTIHTFGFGQEHDSILLNNISKTMDGNYYYVEQIDTVKQQFIDALGGMFSDVELDIEITVRIKNHVNKELNKISVAKTYGDMWIYNLEKNEYKIIIKQFMKDESKEFFLELQIPPILQDLEQNERNIEVLEVETVLYDNIDNKKQNLIKQVRQLIITLQNENEKIPITRQQCSEKFELNYFRVRGADAIQKSIIENRKRYFNKAYNILADFLNEIENYRRKNELKVLYDDIIECLSLCDPEKFQQGQGKIISIQIFHMEKKSSLREQIQNGIQEKEINPFINSNQINNK